MILSYKAFLIQIQTHWRLTTKESSDSLSIKVRGSCLDVQKITREAPHRTEKWNENALLDVEKIVEENKWRKLSTVQIWTVDSFLIPPFLYLSSSKTNPKVVEFLGLRMHLSNTRIPQQCKFLFHDVKKSNSDPLHQLENGFRYGRVKVDQFLPLSA